MFAAAKESLVEALSPQLEALIRNPARRAIPAASLVLWVAIIYDMVMKPFS